MRYFLISYNAIESEGAVIIGNYRFSSNGFPIRKEIERNIIEYQGNDTKIESVAITFMYEFKSEKDYNKFNSEDE